MTDYAPSRPDHRRPRLQPDRRRLGRTSWADDPIGEERLVLNMGPQHPSTHGVLRLVLELEGETVTDARVVIGYLHTGIEKNAEFRTWTQGVTFLTRADYLSPFFNETAYCMGVEQLLGVEAPVARAVDPRADDGDQPALVALGVAGDGRHGTGRAHRDDQRLPRPRALPGRLRDDHRPADEPRVHPSRRRRPGPARGLRREDPRLDRRACARSWTASTSSCAASRSGSTGSRTSAGSASRAASRSVSPARCCGRPGLPWDLRKTEPYLGYETFDFEVPTDDRGDCWSRFVVRIAEMCRVAARSSSRCSTGSSRARP